MKEVKAQLHSHYPHAVTLADNSGVTLRLMTPFDAECILTFARSLPVDDLLFLRTDIMDPDVVAQWVKSRNAGLTITVMAEAGGEIAGYVSLHHNNVTMDRTRNLLVISYDVTGFTVHVN